MANVASLVCSMRSVINKQYMPVAVEKWEGTFAITDPGMVMGHLASYNEYHPMVEKQFSL